MSENQTKNSGVVRTPAGRRLEALPSEVKRAMKDTRRLWDAEKGKRNTDAMMARLANAACIRVAPEKAVAVVSTEWAGLRFNDTFPRRDHLVLTPLLRPLSQWNPKDGLRQKIASASCYSDYRANWEIKSERQSARELADFLAEHYALVLVAEDRVPVGAVMGRLPEWDPEAWQVWESRGERRAVAGRVEWSPNSESAKAREEAKAQEDPLPGWQPVLSASGQPDKFGNYRGKRRLPRNWVVGRVSRFSYADDILAVFDTLAAEEPNVPDNETPPNAPAIAKANNHPRSVARGGDGLSLLVSLRESYSETLEVVVREKFTKTHSDGRPYAQVAPRSVPFAKRVARLLARQQIRLDAERSKQARQSRHWGDLVFLPRVGNALVDRTSEDEIVWTLNELRDELDSLPDLAWRNRERGLDDDEIDTILERIAFLEKLWRDLNDPEPDPEKEAAEFAARESAHLPEKAEARTDESWKAKLPFSWAL